MSGRQMHIMVQGQRLMPQYMWINEYRPYSGKVLDKVVLLIPVYQMGKRCWSLQRAAIERLNPRPAKIIFCENNSTDRTLQEILGWEYPHEIIRVWFSRMAASIPGHEYDGIAHARDLLLTKARHMDLDYAIFLDDDTIPESPDFIQRFIDNGLDLCGGAYSRTFGDGKVYLASKWSTKQSMSEMPYGNDPKMQKVIGEAVARANKSENGYLCFGGLDSAKLYKVAITSGGALALSRKVLEDKRLQFYPIHHELTDGVPKTSEDFGFCLLARSLGYEVYVDGRIRFAHMDTGNKNRPWIINKRFQF